MLAEGHPQTNLGHESMSSTKAKLTFAEISNGTPTSTWQHNRLGGRWDGKATDADTGSQTTHNNTILHADKFEMMKKHRQSFQTRKSLTINIILQILNK